MSSLLRAAGTSCIVGANAPVALLAIGSGLPMKLVRRYLFVRGYKLTAEISGEIRSDCLRHRDAVQFLWRRQMRGDNFTIIKPQLR